MSETADKAEEKLLDSVTKSQQTNTAGSTAKAPASRKRSTGASKQNQKQADATDSNPSNYETRNQFIGNLRWPD